ncbi:MAG TPA: carboxypeptidase-like regulatory domain-containing protein [Vicinamibacterales bacterium]|nr:carboxypeptidase-like regulatory domain-containing protein [Vicinamibacterales bacterium]
MTLMNATRLVLAAVLASALSMPVVSGQEVRITTTGPGDMMQFPAPGREFKTGTGSIRGRVLSADSGSPLRRAQVRIMGPDILAKTALTDAEGRYEFGSLPAGRFTLQATKSGFVSVQYGQTRPFESGRPIELLDKQTLENADIAMPRGSVIAGRILDEYGEPVPDATVSALRQSWTGGRRRLMPVGGRMAQTNDLGQYRLYGLPPGEYYVSATLRGGFESMMAIELMAGRGGGAAAAPTGSNPSSGYAPTYYPGTPSPAEAQRVSLALGQEILSADFALLPVRLATITGVVVGSDGTPLGGAMVSVAPSSRDFGAFIGPQSTTRTNKDGAFTLNGVAPGDYMLQANSVQVFTSSEGGNTMVFAMRTAGPGGGATEFGSVPISVAGEDIANIVLATSKGGTATGRVTFDGGSQPPGGSLRVTAAPADFSGPVGFGGSTSGVVQADGGFELKGIAGPRLIRVSGAPQGWTLKSVRLNGVDITDTGADFKPGENVSGLEVVLTSRTTTVTGSVTAGDGSLVKDYTVVLFAEDPEYWQMPMTRWVTGTRPDQEGRFKVQNLPPGSYYAVAVDYIPQGEWGDPELLDRLKVKARRFTLTEGDSEVLDLKIAEGY